MGQAKIISGGPTGLYNIQLQLDTAKVITRLAAINKRLTALIPLIATATTAVEAEEIALSLAQGELEEAITPEGKTAATNKVLDAMSTLTSKRRALATLNLEQTSIGKEKTSLQSVSATADRNNIWCADLTENMPAGKDIGTIEINGEDTAIKIMPAGSTGLGKLQPTQASGPAGVFYNWALQACWQKWKPTYRVGEIKAIYYTLDKADVCIDATFSKTRGLPINQSGVECSQELGALYDGFMRFAEENPTHPMITNTATTTITMSEQLVSDMDEVNNYVNTNHKYKQDVDKLDKWNFLEPGADGDCEDFALTKLQMLLDKGYPISALKFEAGEISTGKGHGWLTVKTTEGDKCLDINYQNVMPSYGLNYTNRSILTGTKWERSGVLLSFVPIEYMSGDNASVFEIGDRVIVAFTNQAWSTPKVIGFESNPKSGLTAYREQGGIVETINAKSGEVINSNWLPADPDSPSRYLAWTTYESELYILQMELTHSYPHIFYERVVNLRSGAAIRKVETNFILPAGGYPQYGLSADVAIGPGTDMAIWTTFRYTDQYLQLFCGLFVFNPDGAENTHQHDSYQYGTPEFSIQSWGIPGRLVFHPSSNHLFACDRQNGRIKKINITTVLAEAVYYMPGSWETAWDDPYDIVIVDSQLFVLTIGQGDYVQKIREYVLSQEGNLTFVKSITVCTVFYTHGRMQYTRGKLFVSAGISEGTDKVFVYDLTLNLIQEISLPYRANSTQHERRIYIG